MESSSKGTEKSYIKDEENASDDEDERMWAAISFVVILIIIGVPLWWKMTEVERSYFPYEEISELNQRSVMFPIDIYVSSNDSNEANSLTYYLNESFRLSTFFIANFKTISYAEELYKMNVNELESNSSLHMNKPGSILLLEIEFPFNKNIIVGKHRTVYFKKGTDAQEVYNFLEKTVLQEEILLESFKPFIIPGYTSNNLDFLRKIRPNPKYDVIFTVVNPQPERIKFEWNSKLVLKEFFQPLLDQLKILSEFNIKSQWLYLVDLQQNPKKVGDHFQLNQKQIPHIITPLEKKIGSGVAKNPCINFVLYITKCEHIPMKFVDDDASLTDAVLSARWGGVQLVNPNVTDCINRHSLGINPKRIMKIFLKQFKTLIGLDDLSHNQRVLRSNEDLIFPWQLDGLYRMRILEQFISSRITLTSLSQLLGEISNIVITNEVGNAVLEAVHATKETLNMLQRSELVEALNFSTISFISSEFAFTHPSLLALLYFPDDQKYAVYIPLYLPVMIPVLLSLKNIQNWLKKKFVKNKIKTKEE